MGEKLLTSVRSSQEITMQEAELLSAIDLDRLPDHIAIIMDGNGRWAKGKHLPRIAGHRAGMDAVRETELALGKTQREMSVDEIDGRKMIRRSLVSKVQISIGEKISLKNIKFARPGTGISTNEFQYAEGQRAKKNIPPETIIQWDMLER